MKCESAIWKLRVLNYLIDSFCIVIIFYLALKLISVSAKYVPFSFSIDFILLLLLIFILYYLAMETLTSRTIGKFITRTKVISVSGIKPSFGKIVIRSIVRIFFIEVISFFSLNPLGWHDRISGTKVVLVKDKAK